jgi:hypothetical protein
MRDIGSVMRSLHRERLVVRFRGASYPMPAWADWLIWLGAWMRSQAVLGGRRVTVVLLPTRRLAAAFVGLGTMLAASRLHDDILDWEALQALPAGSLVRWRDPKGRGGRKVNLVGTLDGVRDVDGSQLLAIVAQAPSKYRNVTYLLSRGSALSYGVTQGAITSQGEDALVQAAALLKAVVDDSSEGWIRSPMADSTLVTERSSFLSDLEDIFLETGNLPGTALRNVLALADPEDLKHGKLRLIATRSRGYDDIGSGVTILDGASATAWLGQSSARSVVVLLDHADFDEEVANSLSRFLGHSVDEGIHSNEDSNPIVAPPSSIDVFAFALPACGEDSEWKV